MKTESNIYNNPRENNRAFVNNIKTGVIWNSLLGFGRQGLNFLATIILARLLTPEDYGLLGMMAILVSVSEVLMEAGLGAALIKKQDVKEIDYSTLSTYNVVIAIILYALIFFTSPFVSEFYATSSLKLYIRLYAVVILIDSLSIVPKVQLMKDLKFKQLSIINIASGICGLIGAIILALMNTGIFSLIFQYIISSIVLTLSLVIFTKYKPVFSFSLNSFKEMIGFGLNTTGANILKSSTENIFVNAVAKISPLSTAGFFNQSYKLQNVLSSICNTVIDGALFPVLSKESNGSIVRHSTSLNYYSMSLLSFIVFLLIINIEIVILIFLGEKWTGTIPFLKVFLLVGLIQTYTSLNRNLLKSLGITLDILIFETIASICCLSLMLIWGHNVNYLLILLLLYVVLRFSMSIFALHRKNIITIIESIKITLKATMPSLFPFIICTLLTEVYYIKSIVIINLLYIFLFIVISRLVGFNILAFIRRYPNDCK
ncbi:MAG: oligosaccharide flippase family protein [Lachnospiraceae bacterium]|nr:oligosaccharide flippase family protein [Lachnospiraceae bacterium]